MKIRFVGFIPPCRLPGRWHFELMTVWVNSYSVGLLVMKRGIEIILRPAEEANGR